MTDPDAQELLHSVASVARAIYGAAASAIFLLDRDTETLVFKAVAGVGEDRLVGAHFPANLGVLGWVMSSGEPIIVDELVTNRQCAQEIVSVTGYLPGSMMAAPLLSNQDMLGLLLVLDPVAQSRSSLTDLDLLALFANQAAIALRVVTAQAGRLGARTEARAELLDELKEFLQRSSG